MIIYQKFQNNGCLKTIESMLIFVTNFTFINTSSAIFIKVFIYY